MGSWLLSATDGPAYLVTVRGADVHAHPAEGSARATAVLEGSSRDLLALLLGRPRSEGLRVLGDPGFGGAFSRAFPGP